MTFLHPLFEKGVSLFLSDPLWQSLGFLAMFILFYAFSLTDDKKVVRILLISNFFWIAHFYFLDNTAALFATLIAMVRLWLSLKFKGSLWAMIFVTVACIISGIFSYTDPISILPIIATIAASYWFFFLEKTELRLLLILTSSMWFVYHLETGSMSWVINEIIVSFTLLIAIYKFQYGEEKRIYIRRSIRDILKKRPVRVDFGRFMYLRDKARFK